MDVLVVQASKHGSTEVIAGLIADRLVERGHAATVFDAEAADDLDRAELGRRDAVVIGSAVYLGHWLKPARRFVDHHADELADRPVWLFSSGPLEKAPTADDEPVEVHAIEEQLDVRDHRIFNGALDRHDLNLAERAAMKLVGEHEGDYRDPEAIRAWADDIANALV
ncbi:MAG TPA: flavodoxin domain-containing protein [Acidimicrobiales bacterium]|nr:flavodoxin domain-containing protein [Acidimicrobiales bacterium]